MEWILFYIVIGLLVTAVRLVREYRNVEEETLCLTCVNAVVTRGVRGQKWVACNLSGNLRPVKFAVCECTAFCVPNHVPQLVTIEGFAPRPREVYARVNVQ